MAILGINITSDMAMARQALLKGASAGQFQKTLVSAIKGVVKGGTNSVLDDSISQGTSTIGSTTGSTAGTSGTDAKKLKGKIDEAMAVGFVAPMLTDALGRFDQRYFANSPAEQAYANQLYTEIATKIGQSGKFPIGRDIAQAMLQRLQSTAQTSTSSSGTQSSAATSGAAQSSGTQQSAAS